MSSSLEQASRWLVLLGSEQVTAQQRMEYEQWALQHPREAAAISKLNSQLRNLNDQGLGNLPSQQLARVVSTSTSRRRLLRAAGSVTGLSVLALLIGPATQRALQPGEHWQTKTAERRHWRLVDGSRLALNACTSVRSLHARSLELLQGQISLDIASGSLFQVNTQHGSVLATQARLVLRYEKYVSQVSLLGGSARLLSDGREYSLSSGQRARFNSSGLLSIDLASSADEAWTRGLLRVENQPLSQVIDALQDYRHGLIQLDPRLASRRVSGIYPLDDTDRSLALLSDSLGLRLQFFSRYWVRIGPA